MNDPGPNEPAPEAMANPPPFPHTSDMMLALLERCQDDAIVLGDLIAGLMNRVLGFVMLLFAIPCIIPMPPGIAFLCGLVLLSCGIHLLIGRQTLWLPGMMARRTISRAILERIVLRAVPVARRLERLCRPRWAWLTSRLGRAVLGCVVITLAIILLLPIPLLGNLPPGVAVAVLALGFIERDGLVIGLGFVASLAAVAVTSAMTWAAIRGLDWMM